jgi:hypothetical protein
MIVNLAEDEVTGHGSDLSSVITIVIVTSPTASNPNTEMIDRCMAGVIRSFPELNSCRIVIACDGVQVVDSVSKNQKAKTKRIFGKCTKESFNRYEQYCQALEAREWLKVDRQTEWKGFALTLRSALKQVTTPLVMVLPHDYELSPRALARIDVRDLLHEMVASTGINYIGLPNPRSSTIKSRHAEALRDLQTRRITGRNSEISLEPLAMWKENPHFAKMEAYQTIVFSRHYKRGQFIEDTLGQEMLSNIKEKGREAFPCTYLLSLNAPCSFHMDGPRYLPILERQTLRYSVQDFEVEAAEQADEFARQKTHSHI